MSALVRLYPAAWRARYGAEFETLLAERPPTARDLVDIVIGAVDARISPQVGEVALPTTPWTSRASGGSAILGGLLWSVVVAGAALDRSQGDDTLPMTLPLLIALGLMLLSLPGRYMRRYARPIILGVAAASISFAILYAEILPWGAWLLIPFGLIGGAVGPGAFALAAARAGIGSGTRWRLLAVLTPTSVIGIFLALSGLATDSMAGLALVASLLPIGLAWIYTGARIATGKVSNSMTTTGGLA